MSVTSFESGYDRNEDARSADQLIEEGVGLIAKGMFRLGDKSHEANPQAAYDAGMAVVSTVRGMSFDFLKIANAKK